MTILVTMESNEIKPKSKQTYSISVNLLWANFQFRFAIVTHLSDVRIRPL